MNDSLLTLKDVETRFYTYAGVVKALDGVDLTLRRKEWLGLVGETGCGKSVTAYSILRIVPTPGEIIRGEIRFEGQNLMALSEEEMRKIRGGSISMIFQDPSSSLNPSFRIIDQVAEVFMLHQGTDKREARRRAAETLETVGITREYFSDFAHQLSGGMKQRVMIALATSCRPKLLIADEPTSNLDVTIQAQILDLLKKLQPAFGMSVLLITHNLGIVAETCDKVAVMYSGKIVESARLEDFFENPKHPYTLGLFNSIVNVTQRKEWLESIQGSVPDLISPPSGCRFHPRCKHATPVCSEVSPSEVEISPEHMVACHLCH